MVNISVSFPERIKPLPAGQKMRKKTFPDAHQNIFYNQVLNKVSEMYTFEDS